MHYGTAVRRGIAERQAANRAHQLLKLAAGAGVNRPMAGIMRARREFVNQQLACARQKEFDAKHTDYCKLCQYGTGNLDRLCRHPGHDGGP